MALKIKVNNYKPAPAEFPQEITCPWCQSVITVEAAADIKNDMQAKQAESSSTVPAKGFICPACGGTVITG